MKKYIVGLGCSWVQGEGGYPEYIWKAYKGRVNIRRGPDEHLRKFEHENSWVNVLCRDHMPEYEPVNLGVRGNGNRASVKQLYFSDVDLTQGTGYIILLLSGFERFDFFRQDPYHKMSDTYKHYKWRGMYPHDNPESPDDKILWSWYVREMWSDQFVANESMLAMLELQMFCKLHGYKMIVANSFNQQKVHHYMDEHAGGLSKKFDWNRYLHDHASHDAMIQKLIELDGFVDPSDWRGYYEPYYALTWPKQYLTNCLHPTIDGYKVIANEFYEFIKNHDL